MLVVEFADLEIRSAVERYRTSMAKYVPKPFTLYRGGSDRAVNGFASSNAAINVIESATEVIAEARKMPLGQLRSDALGEAGRLRIAAEMNRWLSTK